MVGISHKTAPVHVRERVAMALWDRKAFRHQVGGLAEELCLLTTCNRAEVYAVSERPAACRERLRQLLVPGREESLASALVTREEEAAARHLFRVAAGLESMVLGERQILGQVKEAYQQGRAEGTVGPVLDHLFRSALHAGKRVQTETDLGQHAVSFGYAALQAAQQVLSSLQGKSILLVGAGRMMELVLTHLHGAGAGPFVLVNRGRERPQALAERFPLVLAGYEELQARLAEADAVVTSTSAPHTVISREMVVRAMAQRPGRPLFVCDLAVPRDVDPEAGTVPGVFLYNVDDLQSAVEEGVAARRQAAVRAEAIVEEEVAEYVRQTRARGAVPLIRALRARAEVVREAELRRALGRLGPLSERQVAIIEQLTRTLVNKLLDRPVAALRAFSQEPDAEVWYRVMREAFGLTEEELAAASEEDKG